MPRRRSSRRLSARVLWAAALSLGAAAAAIVTVPSPPPPAPPVPVAPAAPEPPATAAAPPAPVSAAAVTAPATAPAPLPPPADDEPRAAAPAVPAPAAPPESGAATARAAAVALALPLPPTPRPAALASFDPAHFYPVALWSPAGAPVGWLDGVEFAGAPVAGPAARRLADDDVIEARGWAGDPDLGVRMALVLISLCDTVVGAAPVAGPRPDVAASVHPNLARSGWRARLLVAHLPRCADARLQAWAVPPAGRTVLPVNGAVALDLPPAKGAVHAGPAPGAKPVRPEDRPQALPTTRIHVAAPLEARRCGRPECAVVARIAAGDYTGYVFDEAEGWVLLTFGARPGWVPRPAVRLAPAGKPG